MAALTIIKFSLPLMMLMAGSHCATYRFGGTFGAESELNLTSTGFGTLKSNNTESSGIGGEWNGTVYGAGYGNYDDLHEGVIFSVNKEVSLKPGDGIANITNNDAKVRGKFFFADLAKRFSQFFFGNNSSKHDE